MQPDYSQQKQIPQTSLAHQPVLFIPRLLLLLIICLFLFFLGFFFGIKSVPPATTYSIVPSQSSPSRTPVACVQIVVFAKESANGTCQSFPNPCVVPHGWQLCS